MNEILIDEIVKFNLKNGGDKNIVEKQVALISKLIKEYNDEGLLLSSLPIKRVSTYCLLYFFPEKVCRELFNLCVQLDNLFKERITILKAPKSETPKILKLNPNMEDFNIKDRELHFLILTSAKTQYKSDKILAKRIVELDNFFMDMKERQSTPDELLIRIFGGEQYIKIYEETIKSCVSYLIRNTHQGEILCKYYDKDDLLSEARFALLVFIRRFKPGKKALSSNIRKTIKDCFYNLLRNINRDKRKVHKGQKDLQIVDKNKKIISTMIVQPRNNISFENKIKKLTDLTEREQYFLTLYCQEDRPLKEIAKIFNFSEKTIHRELKRIKTILKNKEYLVKEIMNSDPTFLHIRNTPLH